MKKLLKWFFSSPKKDEKRTDLYEVDIRIPSHLKIRKTVTYSKYVIVENQAAAIKVTNDRTILAVIGTKSKPKLLLFSCPCGCNELLRVNLSSAVRPAWRIKFNKNDTISLYPSVDLDSGCRAHFILRDNKALVL